jgi:hypothetical protein
VKGKREKAKGKRDNEAGGWLLLLCAYLGVWRPMTMASEVSATLGSLGMRGPAGVSELSVHAAVTAFAVAAGWGLWIGNPKAPVFAEMALVACALASVQSLYWTRLPSDTMPGDRLPLAIVAIAHAAGWMSYLRKSRRVRALFVSGEADATSWLSSTRSPSP